MNNEILLSVKLEFEKCKISKLTQNQKNFRYGELMTRLELSYEIPLLKIDLVSSDVPDEVVELYQELSDARDFSIYE